ncbi:hypothetical protein SYNPS1DRAFT_31600 [Syncephalis pseudoplumigaleata]|uniref:Uncharacterized protein n=1 Tax=Syncephalis pseudoplumigaleata TaxID=1712513 RepID=A0A4P9YU89_9FUNG|nr:hypothetical protein SYNPS1DRAFT_31600 [Syncephalis pseudoplumigaleata]|eukprot:RKP22761.1 hypothetical protein SYNPS1DRAFT_31600 [Syncephalis pseudoplumigaleata]
MQHAGGDAAKRPRTSAAQPQSQPLTRVQLQKRMLDLVEQQTGMQIKQTVKAALVAVNPQATLLESLADAKNNRVAVRIGQMTYSSSPLRRQSSLVTLKREIVFCKLVVTMKETIPIVYERLKPILLPPLYWRKLDESYYTIYTPLSPLFEQLSADFTKHIDFKRARMYPNIIAKVIEVYLIAVSYLNSIGIAYNNLKPEKHTAEIRLVGFEAATMSPALLDQLSNRNPNMLPRMVAITAAEHKEELRQLRMLIRTIYGWEQDNKYSYDGNVGYGSEIVMQYRSQRAALLRIATKIEAHQYTTLADIINEKPSGHGVNVKPSDYRIISVPIVLNRAPISPAGVRRG